jgi:hypothetical protein
MIIKEQFRDLDNNLYTVVITTKDGENPPSYLKLGGSPFVTQMDASNDTLYEPVKGQSATVSFLTKTYIPQLYSAGATDVKVELYKGEDVNELIWVGFTTPNLYDQPYDYQIEELQLECRCGLSALNDIKYKTDKREIKSFFHIIKSLLDNVGCYNYIATNTGFQLEKADTHKIGSI